MSAPVANHNEVTDVIPLDEFDSDPVSDNATTLPLAVPAELRGAPTPPRPGVDAAGDPGAPIGAGRLRGQHRKPATTPARNRILIAAMAAGAASAAAHSALSPDHTATAEAKPAAHTAPTGAADETAQGMQMVTVRPAANTVVHTEELAKGMAFAQERAEREARLQQPLFVSPTRGIFTSGFGYRWGSLHGGIDVANSVGTPILAVSDGVVSEAGPSAGYGQLVKVRHFDGTVTLYGHVDTTTVGVGQRVMAGDQIATMGNRGDSTGPHLHLEVLVNGTNRIDPMPWLANRGINIGG